MGMRVANHKTYICKETFQMNMFDDDGFDMEEVMCIEQGAMFQRTEDDFRLIGGEVRLEGITADEGTWLEISEETLAEYFEEVTEVFCSYGERREGE